MREDREDGGGGGGGNGGGDNFRGGGGPVMGRQVQMPYMQQQQQQQHTQHNQQNHQQQQYSHQQPQQHQQQQHTGPLGCKIYVGNLSWEVKWQELKDFFKPCGTVVRADVMEEPGGRSKGCGKQGRAITLT